MAYNKGSATGCDEYNRKCDFDMSEEQNVFYQSKYEYYRIVSLCTVIGSVLASTTYWISDCQLFDRIAIETLFPRMFMLIPMIFYILLSRRIRSYKVMVPLSYLMLHGIMWCTIWSIYYLPIKQHANEGFIIMHVMFMALGFCAPIKQSICWHSLLIVDILISNLFNHYESLDLMLSLGIPVMIGIEVLQAYMEKVYAEQYRLKKILEHMTTHDQLTNAYNRNKLVELCEPDTKKLKVANTGIILMDVDFFKKINDTYGHGVGDTVLKTLVEIIKSCVRSSDIVIRWGGEEFVILLPECSLYETEEIAERIRKSVEEYDKHTCRFTVSIGVTKYNGIDYVTSINHADKALYHAKGNGRNQTVTYENLAIEGV